jgi:pimeloyl-ACP methyl ester carboxylesterase
VSDVRVGGIRLYYEEHGEGAAIACVHGTGSAAVLWEGAFEALSRLGRVIAYDRRGYTRSERPERFEHATVADHAADLLALLQALDATPAVVIGRSYGGEVALDLALRRPEAVRALVLLEGAPLCLAPESAAYDAALSERLLAVEAREGVDAVGETLIGEVLGADAWRSFPEELRELFTANGPAIVAEVRGGGLRVDAEALATVRQPALLVAAEDSPAPFRAATEALARALPGGRLALAGGGHMVDPAGADVLAFLRAVL